MDSLGGHLDEGWDAVVMPRVLKTDVGHRAHDIDYFAPDGAKYRSKVPSPSSRLEQAHAAPKLTYEVESTGPSIWDFQIGMVKTVQLSRIAVGPSSALLPWALRPVRINVKTVSPRPRLLPSWQARWFGLGGFAERVDQMQPCGQVTLAAWHCYCLCKATQFGALQIAVARALVVSTPEAERVAKNPGKAKAQARAQAKAKADAHATSSGPGRKRPSDAAAEAAAAASRDEGSGVEEDEHRHPAVHAPPEDTPQRMAQKAAVLPAPRADPIRPPSQT